MSVETIGSPLLWAGFIAFVLAMLAVDLGVFHRKAHAVGFREAATWSAVWVLLAGVFGAGVWARFGAETGVSFFTGYLIEKSLSIDNIFVFLVIFPALRIPGLYQHRVLFWGVLSALVLRAGMIFAGAAALERFHWLIYFFGAFLVFTGVKLFLAWKKGKQEHPEQGLGLKMLRKLVPSTEELDGPRFFTRRSGRWLATPLFMALALVEITDVVFAVDSIPAIFAVTKDPFIVFTSNIFAILGLRSLFFLLEGMVQRFHYLKVGLASVLVFVGAKMGLVEVVSLPAFVSLGVIAALLGGSILASWVRTQRLAEPTRRARASFHAPQESSASR